jgi:hypothetical protein
MSAIRAFEVPADAAFYTGQFAELVDARLERPTFTFNRTRYRTSQKVGERACSEELVFAQ